MFWQQSSRYCKKKLQREQQLWSKWKRIDENQRMREPTLWRIMLFQIRRWSKSGASGQIEQSSLSTSSLRDVTIVSPLTSKQGSYYYARTPRTWSSSATKDRLLLGEKYFFGREKDHDFVEPKIVNLCPPGESLREGEGGGSFWNAKIVSRNYGKSLAHPWGSMHYL